MIITKLILIVLGLCVVALMITSLFMKTKKIYLYIVSGCAIASILSFFVAEIFAAIIWIINTLFWLILYKTLKEDLRDD